jgi:hypothetical protein
VMGTGKRIRAIGNFNATWEKLRGFWVLVPIKDLDCERVKSRRKKSEKGVDDGDRR